MAQLVVRDIEEEVKVRLQRRAKRHGRSMEEEVRQILRAASREQPRAVLRLGTSISSRFKKTGLKADLPEFRGDAARPARFEP